MICIWFLCSTVHCEHYTEWINVFFTCLMIIKMYNLRISTCIQYKSKAMIFVYSLFIELVSPEQIYVNEKHC